MTWQDRWEVFGTVAVLGQLAINFILLRLIYLRTRPQPYRTHPDWCSCDNCRPDLWE